MFKNDDRIFIYTTRPDKLYFGQCVCLVLANNRENHNGGDNGDNDQETALLLASVLLVDCCCGELLGGRMGGHANRGNIRLDRIY